MWIMINMYIPLTAYTCVLQFLIIAMNESEENNGFLSIVKRLIFFCGREVGFTDRKLLSIFSGEILNLFSIKSQNISFVLGNCWTFVLSPDNSFVILGIL
ncbi:hypothetical protein Bca52824_036672 [Brassica carinata]|uniref:Uncharacterized protein n=1 Tax=Brassica carinata TaxID=52824 RepID=A0A8X7S5A8_BRACI|nr:hypothetical protein Bca52824_036672 [Brassica carinata]